MMIKMDRNKIKILPVKTYRITVREGGLNTESTKGRFLCIVDLTSKPGADSGAPPLKRD